MSPRWKAPVGIVKPLMISYMGPHNDPTMKYMVTMWAPLRIFEHTWGPHQFCTGIKWAPLRSLNNKSLAPHGPPPDPFNDYMGKKGTLNNNMSITCGPT